MPALLGITPPDDRLGCLQDIHWYDGAWGYFPTYTLGAMTAAQLFAAAKQARPEIPEALGRGDFAPLMGWLAGQVHAQASSAGFEEIVERARSEEHTSELQSLMRISYAVFCLKKKKNYTHNTHIKERTLSTN